MNTVNLTRRILSLALPVAFAALLGCGPLLDPCEGVMCDCAPPVSLKVVKSGGGSVPNVTLEGIQGTCSEDTASGATWCYPAVNSSGTYSFDVKAPDYATKHVEVTVPEPAGKGCCRCFVADRVDVMLDPL